MLLEYQVEMTEQDSLQWGGNASDKRRRTKNIPTITSSLHLMDLVAQTELKCCCQPNTSGNLLQNLLLLILTLGSHTKVCQIQIEMLLKSSRWHSRYFNVFEKLLPSLTFNLILLLNLMFQGIKPWNIHVFRCRCRVLQDSAGLLTCQKLEKLKRFILYITRGYVQSISSSVHVRKTRAEDRKECCDIVSTNWIVPTISLVHFSEETLCVQRPNTNSEHWRKLHEECILVWTIVSKGAFFPLCTKNQHRRKTKHIYTNEFPLQWSTSRKVQASSLKCFYVNKWLNDQ